MDALDAILTRPTVPQAKMAPPGPNAAELRQILQAGAAAPDHGKLQPWRFLLIQGEARERLGELFAAAVRAENPQASAAEVEKQRSSPLRAPLIVVVLATLRLRQAKVPEIEQLASAAAAAQNVLLAAHALGFAGKWSTGRNAYDPHITAGLGLGTDERIMGFLFIGNYMTRHEASPRPALEAVVSSWEG